MSPTLLRPYRPRRKIRYVALVFALLDATLSCGVCSVFLLLGDWSRPFIVPVVEDSLIVSRSSPATTLQQTAPGVYHYFAYEVKASCSRQDWIELALPVVTLAFAPCHAEVQDSMIDPTYFSSPSTPRE